jgi:REP-associated tyrosine transposase
VCFSAKGAALSRASGNAPGSWNPKRGLGLKARFTFREVGSIIGGMPQSLSKVILHIIFSTRNHEQWLDSDVRPRMHAYLATICRDVDANFVRVDRIADHVHIVTTLPRTLSQAQLIEQIKKTSSKWIKEFNARYHRFFWQRGYGAFSVSPSQLAAGLEYVNKQREHHRRGTFQEEYRELLRKHRVDFDERHVWD